MLECNNDANRRPPRRPRAAPSAAAGTGVRPRAAPVPAPVPAARRPGCCCRADADWLITDTHWNHDHMLTTGRPEDYAQQIAKNWRHLIGPDDVVFHLGDVILKHSSELKDILASLPG